jgi:hypothetical protein
MRSNRDGTVPQMADQPEDRSGVRRIGADIVKAGIDGGTRGDAHE